MDDPEKILKECLENHYQMIKQFRGEYYILAIYICNDMYNNLHKYLVLVFYTITASIKSCSTSHKGLVNVFQIETCSSLHHTLSEHM